MIELITILSTLGCTYFVIYAGAPVFNKLNNFEKWEINASRVILLGMLLSVYINMVILCITQEYTVFTVTLGAVGTIFSLIGCVMFWKKTEELVALCAVVPVLASSMFYIVYLGQIKLPL